MARQPADGFVVLTLRFHKEERYWVGECEELGTATDGRSLDKVRRDLEKLLTLHLDGLEQIGERERVFAERGIKLYTDHAPPTVDRSVPVSGEDDALLQFRSVPVSVPRAALVPA